MSSSYGARPAFAARPLLHALAQNWWVFLLRGLTAIVFGVLTFVWPAVTFATLVLLFGAYVLVDGVLAIISAITGNSPMPRWWLAIVGIAGIAAGLVTFARPDVAAAALLLVIAIWALTSGAMEIIGAIQLRKEIDNEWLLILSGFVAIVFGVLLLVRPAVASLALILTIGTFAIAYGLLLIAFSIRLKSHKPAKA